MKYFTTILNDLLHIFFPHICVGCGTDILDKDAMLCIRCLDRISFANFNRYEDNLTEKNFWGRIPVVSAGSLCYFTKDSLIRRLMHQLKYRGNKDLGHFLGRMMGASLAASNRFNNIDTLIPLPLFPSKEKRRGYNQSTILCEGIAEVLQLPILRDVIKRVSFTDTQTKKSRIERWENMDGRFELKEPDMISGRHILLVDDIITTGATLEACGQQLLKAEGVTLSIATLAYTVK